MFVGVCVCSVSWREVLLVSVCSGESGAYYPMTREASFAGANWQATLLCLVPHQAQATTPTTVGRLPSDNNRRLPRPNTLRISILHHPSSSVPPLFTNSLAICPLLTLLFFVSFTLAHLASIPARPLHSALFSAKIHFGGRDFANPSASARHVHDARLPN